MPIYEYQCEECSERFDKFVRSMFAEVEVECPACGSAQVNKAFSTLASRGSNGGTAAIPSAPNCAPSG
jgi:putative FmdB family regulatory protein